MFDVYSSILKFSEKLNSEVLINNNPIFRAAQTENRWFNEQNIKTALNNWVETLRNKESKNWFTDNYRLLENPKRIGIVCAGNIPLVGFHDVLSVLLSGHLAVVKLSSQDTVLMTKVLDWLCDCFPNWKDNLEIVEKLGNVDALIATGSDNTARYFEYYFAKIPRLIRKNRTSIAVLNGEETDEQIVGLGEDIFTYFGLGCRNISKLFVPDGYDFVKLLSIWERNFSYLPMHTKYFNNYEYRKSIYIINNINHFDDGCVLLLEDKNIFSHIATLHYEFYQNLNQVQDIINSQQEQIQVISTMLPGFSNSCTLGQTQKPKINEYADGVDTIAFLMDL
ncbi:MAG: acyl-CoA reductase [Cytophagales bacterium]